MDKVDDDDGSDILIDSVHPKDQCVEKWRPRFRALTKDNIAAISFSERYEYLCCACSANI